MLKNYDSKDNEAIDDGEITQRKNNSIWRCAYCKPLEERSYESALLEEESKGWDFTTGRYVNPTTCPYTHVKIDGEIYEYDASVI